MTATINGIQYIGGQYSPSDFIPNQAATIDGTQTVENGVLTVESDREGNSESNGQEIIHRGISKRYFKKSFSISDDVEIRGAELKDGLLRISMEKIIPESRKRKEISIK